MGRIIILISMKLAGPRSLAAYSRNLSRSPPTVAWILKLVRSRIKPDDPHFAMTRLLVLENTHNGKVWAWTTWRRHPSLRDAMGCAASGWRAGFQRSNRLGVEVKEIVRHVDSVSICFPKALALRSGRYCAAPAHSSPRRNAVAKWLEVASARPACWRHRSITRSTIMSIACGMITRTPNAWLKPCLRLMPLRS